MRHRKLDVVATILAAALQSVFFQPARADDIDLSTIKCSEFVSSKPADIGNIMIWLEGYYTKENDPPILHSDKMMKDGKNLGDYCRAHPDTGLIDAAEAVMPVK
jgi:acid stress chaperone HdeB